MLVGLLLLGIGPAAEPGQAQWSSGSDRIYTLLEGSTLTDDCPICDRMPIVVPLRGSFRLHLISQNPIITLYEIQDLALQAGSLPGPQYSVVGAGAYQVGGEVALAQDLWLNAQIDNGSEQTKCLAANADRRVSQPWPKLEVNVDQTNGTPAKVYRLALVAVPALQFVALTPDRRTGHVRLQWDGNAGHVQVERAATVQGPYQPLSPITTDTSFTDPGALTNRWPAFYRLRQY